MDTQPQNVANSHIYKKKYQYEHFTADEYVWDVFPGPKAGEKFIDAELIDPNTGATVKLSDLAGKWLVLESGSTTCSIYSLKIQKMNALRAAYPDVEFLVVYVREAHPGERLSQHRSMEEKMEAAKTMLPLHNEQRRILVDSFDGHFHHAYGAMPNILYVIRPDGTIHYRCNWAIVNELKKALDDRQSYHPYENADAEKIRLPGGNQIEHMRTMYVGGFRALYDFFTALPKVVYRHFKFDRYYKKHRKFYETPTMFEKPSKNTDHQVAETPRHAAE